MRRFSTFLAVAVLLGALVSPAPAQTVAGERFPRVGREFPNFSLPDVEGRQVSLNDFRGKAVMLSFWSCYTDTCFTSARVIEDLLKEYSSQGLVAPTVCSEVPPALEKNSYSGLLEQCGTGQVVLIDKYMELKNRLEIVDFPTTFLIDRNNVVWDVRTGVRPLMTEEFRALVKSLLTE